MSKLVFPCGTVGSNLYDSGSQPWCHDKCVANVFQSNSKTFIKSFGTCNLAFVPIFHSKNVCHQLKKVENHWYRRLKGGMVGNDTPVDIKKHSFEGKNHLSA